MLLCSITIYLSFITSLQTIAQTTFQAGELQFTIDNKGIVTELTNKQNLVNYVNRDTSSCLLSVISGGKQYRPASVDFDATTKLLHFRFQNPNIHIVVSSIQKSTHLSLEILKAEPVESIDAIAWGPIYTSISKTIGEVVGVVRDDKVSLGMLLCNAKTLGGKYNNDGTCDERGSLAWPWKSGSSLQAYSINRDREREVDAMEQENIPLKPIKGETVVGSKVALFSCEENKTLDRIEQIILAEKLPYPMIKGVWAKKVFLQSPSYLISDFKESEIDQVIGYAKKGGFFSIYHEGPFNTWGHYTLDTSYFPNGSKGIRQCAEKTKMAGLFFGVHTLTNFITTNDEYVTPRPDTRLAITGYRLLTKDITTGSTEITVSDDTYFKNEKNNNLHTIRIGDELIRYKSVSMKAPFMLMDCQRGAFGTTAESHRKNDTVKKLIDHAYKVFFPNLDLQREIAVNLAKFFNETGISHLDFDGHEGCFASGEGDYAMCLFAEDFYKTIGHDLVNGTSRSKPWYWYINTLCNWGEPWYGGFRESMQEYRISNQAMLSRNFFPNMLGWYMLTKHTSMAEMEWMLARAAGWNAGFAMVIRMKSIAANPLGNELLDMIREWESARLSGAFTKDQQERLKNSKNEFHLEKVRDKEWKLFQFSSSGPYIIEKQEKQPGEPTASVVEFNIGAFEQNLQFTLEIKGDTGSIKNLIFAVDNYNELRIPNEIKAGETLIFDGAGMLRIYDKKGKQRSSIDMHGKIPVLSVGKHRVSVDAEFIGDEAVVIELLVKWMDWGEEIGGSGRGIK